MPDNIEWRIAEGIVPYPEALMFMENRVNMMLDGKAGDMVWLLEHPPVYTAGTSAHEDDLLPEAEFPVYATGRGGKYTYHGPGQRVGYVMLNLGSRSRDLRYFILCMENWLIEALAALGVKAYTAPGRIGIWTDGPQGEAKIGAIGVRVRRWITFHGFAINVDPDLGHFNGIVPCGIRDYGVTSLKELGIATPMARLDSLLYLGLQKFMDDLSRHP